MRGTIKSKRDVERLFRSGRRSTSYLLTILVLPVEQGFSSGRCAFIAGKKLGTAPLRNRCKRVMRATARELGAPWDGFDVAFIAKKSIAFQPHSKVVSKVAGQLQELGIGN